MSAQTLTASLATPLAVTVEEQPKAKQFSKRWMHELAAEVRKKFRVINFDFQNSFYHVGKNKEIIRKTIFEVGGFKTWSKSRAWKKYDLKKFYYNFVRDDLIKHKVRGINPLKLPKTLSGKFNNEAFLKVAKELRNRVHHTQKTEEAFRRNALKMFGLKKWDRSKFQGEITFSKFLKNYVLRTDEVNICRQEGDFRGNSREVLPLSPSINFRYLRLLEYSIPVLSDEDVCSLCLESIDPSDPNKVFVSACNHKFHYECVKEGYEHLFINTLITSRNTFRISRKFKCPNCRQHSDCDRVISNPNHG